jgi:D-glycero-beta-D-manno-heptose-7-phosphate kinase
MIKFSKEKLIQVFDNFKEKKIAVIGDIMLDRYLWGSVNRISPEAPVPVVEVQQESNRFGGSSNVANNIKSLSGYPFLIGVIGDDLDGKILIEMMNAKDMTTEGLVIDNSIPTTVKTRIIAHNQHVVRIDKENKLPIPPDLEEKLIKILHDNIEIFDAIIIEDYNKGAITKHIIEETIKLSQIHNIPVTVDPKYNNFSYFNGVKLFKPNKKEAEEILGIKIVDNGSVIDAMKLLVDKLNCENVLLTRGEKGMALLEKNGDVTYIRTRARQVADVSGAGDTVISTISMALVSGCSIKESAVIANFAAGLVCEEIGAVPINKESLLNTLLNESTA